MNPFRRSARAQPSPLTHEQARLAWQAISVLLDYPGDQAERQLALVRDAVATLPGAVRMPLTSFVDAVADRTLEELRQEYVETFDHTRRCCLYLTYFSFGDTRRRGLALVQLKQAYRRAGADLAADELPDHLGVVLQFGATVDVDAATRLLTDHRAGVEMLRIALQERGSVWAHLLVALCATLPELDGDGLVAVQRLIDAGPPQEDVGLDGYAMDPRLNPRPTSERPGVELGLSIPVGAP